MTEAGSHPSSGVCHNQNIVQGCMCPAVQLLVASQNHITKPLEFLTQHNTTRKMFCGLTKQRLNCCWKIQTAICAVNM